MKPTNTTMDARDRFFTQMRHQCKMRQLKKAFLSSLILIALAILALCIYLYGLAS